MGAGAFAKAFPALDLRRSVSGARSSGRARGGQGEGSYRQQQGLAQGHGLQHIAAPTVEMLGSLVSLIA